jgi:hypothetical protein
MAEKPLTGELHPDQPKATFFGIDWGGKDSNGLICPSCATPHRWRKRTPKHCRYCGVKFLYTASSQS